ncbi:MAG: (d)CMP kinase [Butyrivibrio sp.]|nr:(d)CMP kinase [Butyrivibrio sp.]MBQ7614317.1 (d)CMP kinase [Butyrivibrio sp.]
MSKKIAIDGPAGAGKSTIAKIVAKELGFIYVDTGAMYRAMALYMINNNIDASDSEKISATCQSADITIRHEGGVQRVYLNGEDVSELVRKEEVGKMASASSVNGDVRKKLVELQQKLAQTTDVVMDGRDIGTVVLPDADLKVFLTASSRVRANRRYKELTAKGEICDIDAIEKDIIERDYRDSHREISPLKQAEDAVLVDTSDMTIDEVAGKIIDLYNNVGAKSSF